MLTWIGSIDIRHSRLDHRSEVLMIMMVPGIYQLILESFSIVFRSREEFSQEFHDKMQLIIDFRIITVVLILKSLADLVSIGCQF